MIDPKERAWAAYLFRKTEDETGAVALQEL